MENSPDTPRTEYLKHFIKHCKSRAVVIRSTKVALIVGTILALINHSDVLITRSLTTTSALQIFLTYFVPYVVSMTSSAMQASNTHFNNKNFEKRSDEDMME